jgi:hypothetical protein
MGQQITQTRVIVAGIFLFAVVIITAYLQSVLHFNTYLALAICVADTIGAMVIIFGDGK